MYSLKFGPSNVIILCNKKAIHELWDKKGLVYAERPKNYVADIITSGDSIVFAPNTVETREKRRIATHNFSVMTPLREHYFRTKFSLAKNLR